MRKMHKPLARGKYAKPGEKPHAACGKTAAQYPHTGEGVSGYEAVYETKNSHRSADEQGAHRGPQAHDNRPN